MPTTNIWAIFSLSVGITRFIIQPRQFEVHYVNSPRQMSKCKYIVVEGPIGVGKTSLAKLLANDSVVTRAVVADGESLIREGEVAWCNRMGSYRGHAGVDVVKRLLGVET